MELEKLSVAELEALLKEEQVKGKNLKNKIRNKMLRISAQMKRYDISAGPGGKPLNFNSNVKKQLIAQIKQAQAYNKKLETQWAKIEPITALDVLKTTLGDFDNINVSKQVEILRNLGYSEEEIDIILSQISGDENYDELKEKANDILVDYYSKGQQGENEEPKNDYDF